MRQVPAPRSEIRLFAQVGARRLPKDKWAQPLVAVQTPVGVCGLSAFG